MRINPAQGEQSNTPAKSYPHSGLRLSPQRAPGVIGRLGDEELGINFCAYRASCFTPEVRRMISSIAAAQYPG